MSSNFKSRMRLAINRLGWDLHRHDESQSTAHQLVRMMAYHKVGVLLDVGANSGQYGLSMRQAGYRNRIVSFEPLVAPHAQLVRNAGGDDAWTVHSRCAVGAEQGEITMNVSANSVSSSIRGMLPLHLEAEPRSAVVGKETAPIIRLDAVFSDYCTAGEVAALKIDTQGYEAEVLKGADGVLHMISLLQVELSLMPLYEGQLIWDQFIAAMTSRGFHLWGLLPGFFDPRSGRTLQVDVVFARA